MTRALTVSLTLLLAACATTPAGVEKRPEIAGTPAKDFYPLAVGNSWTYEVDQLGAKDQHQITVTKEEDGQFVDSDGNRLFADAFGVRDEKRYLMRDPVEVGTEWSNVVSVSSVERYKIVATNVACDAPAGHFEGCAVVESTNKIADGRQLVNEMTFAPKVGLVRISILLLHQDQKIPQSSLTLTKYTVVPGK